MKVTVLIGLAILFILIATLIICAVVRAVRVDKFALVKKHQEELDRQNKEAQDAKRKAWLA